MHFWAIQCVCHQIAILPSLWFIGLLFCILLKVLRWTLLPQRSIIRSVCFCLALLVCHVPTQCHHQPNHHHHRHQQDSGEHWNLANVKSVSVCKPKFRLHKRKPTTKHLPLFPYCCSHANRSVFGGWWLWWFHQSVNISSTIDEPPMPTTGHCLKSASCLVSIIVY